MTATRPQPLVGWAPLDPGPAVVVGVEASVHSQGALAWAAWEAAAESRPLLLVHVLEPPPFPDPHHTVESEERHARDHLSNVVRAARRRHPGTPVRQRIVTGRPELELVRLSAHQRYLVVGRQGRGRAVHLMVGATAREVAGRASLPVIVVPEEWHPERHMDQPVVLGVDPHDVQPEAIRFAFAEAARRHVPLIATHGSPGGTPETTTPPESTTALKAAVEPFCDEFPDVPVELLNSAGHPVTALLEEVAPCQLIVVGRHTSAAAPTFPIGSVARGVLNYADVPVAVVPPVSELHHD